MTTFFGICIAIFGAFIAWGQWHTARQKLVLDLFEKRYERYQQLRSTFMHFGTNPPPSFDDHYRITQLLAETKMLFGDDVIYALQNLEAAYFDFRRVRGGILPLNPLLTAGKLEQAHAFYLECMALAHKSYLPYLRMDQKLPEGAIAKVKRLWATRPTGD